MKRVYIAMMLVLLIFLSACGKDSTRDGEAGKDSKQASVESAKMKEYENMLDPKNPLTVEVWHYYNGVQKNEFDRLVAEFNAGIGAQKGILVEGVSKGGTSELVSELLRAADREVGAQKLPNISTSYSDVAWELDQKEVLSDLRQYFTNEEIDEFVSGYIQEGEVHRPGQLKILPIAKSTEVMILNKTDWDEFSRATKSELSELETMEGLVRVAKRYYEWTDAETETPNDGRAFFGRDAIANYVFSGMRELSGDLISYDEEGKLTVNTDKASVKKLYDHFYLPYALGYFSAQSRFRSDDMRIGNIICFVGSSTASSYLRDEVMDEQGKSRSVAYEVLPIPHFEGAKRKTATQQGAGMIVLKSEPKLEYASSVFLKWLTAKENNVRFAIGTGYLPVKKSLYEEGAFQEVLRSQGIQTSSLQERSYMVGMKTVRECDLVVPIAFDQSFRLRQELQQMMERGAETAHELYKDLTATIGVDEARKKIQDESLFEQWYLEFAEMVEKYRSDAESKGAQSDIK